MKTTLDLPDDLMREVKIRAAKEGRKLKDVVAESIRNGLAHASASTAASSCARITTDPELGFPLVECPRDAPAFQMSPAEIQRLTEESQLKEDLERVGNSL